MAAATGENYSADRSGADAAGLSLAAIDAMLELKESFLTVGVYVIGN